MNYAMKPVAAAKVNQSHQPLIASVHNHHPFFSRPISSLSFGCRRVSPHKFTSIKASFSNPPRSQNVKGDPQFSEILISLPASFLRTTIVATAATAALFFCRFNLLTVKPAIADPISPTVEAATEDTVSDVRIEKSLEEDPLKHSNDVETLRNLIEERIKNQKPHEAICIAERLIELEPHEQEWRLLKSHMHIYVGETELAKEGFNEIIAKDPCQVGAYHGLAIAVSEGDSIEEINVIQEKVQEAMKMCKVQNRKNDLRDFKLLLAQLSVIEGNYGEALKVYEELIKEEPRDFRPYLCQGIIYTILRKKDLAEKNFQKYRRLVPKNHPYGKFFEENMIASKAFGHRMDAERAGSTS